MYDRYSPIGFKFRTNYHYVPTLTCPTPYLKAHLVTFSFPENLKIQFKNVYNTFYTVVSQICLLLLKCTTFSVF